MMRRNSFCVVVLCLLLSLAVGQVFGQDSVRLEYKFTPDELLRYKMVSNTVMNMQMDIPGMESVPGIRMQMEGIFRQRTKRILENGDAEIVCAIESMKMTMEDHVQELPVNKIPTFTMVISKTGAVKSIEGMEKMQAAIADDGFMDINFLILAAAFPERDLKVGDVWSHAVPVPMGDGQFDIRNELISLDSVFAGQKVANLKQDFSMDMDILFGGAANAPDMDVVTKTTGAGSVSFSIEKGYMVRTQFKMNMLMSTVLNVSGEENSGFGAMNINMDMDFDMSLLPPEQE